MVIQTGVFQVNGEVPIVDFKSDTVVLPEAENAPVDIQVFGGSNMAVNRHLEVLKASLGAITSCLVRDVIRLEQSRLTLLSVY